MTHIALISDNHSYVGDDTIQHLKDVDEIWHAGDIGNLSSIDQITPLAKFTAVYGNIDSPQTRLIYPENQLFECEGMKIFMTHIGGFPGKYTARVKKIINEFRPNIYICGHSHICKVMPDKDHQLLHMNPGAYGHHGFHVVRTILKFSINNGKIEDLRAIELGIRGRVNANYMLEDSEE
jgi:uncharacterized protein